MINGVGLRGHYHCTVLASRLMVENRQGLIVNVPSLRGVRLPELFPSGCEDCVHTGVGVVDQEVELAGLLLLDPLEQLLHLSVYSVVHLNCHCSSSPCLDL